MALERRVGRGRHSQTLFWERETRDGGLLRELIPTLRFAQNPLPKIRYNQENENMETLSVDTETLNIINTLASQLNTSQIKVVRQAVNNYIDKIQRKNRLMSFAGILDETEAEIMLTSIQDSRVNKTIRN